jgi:hypothetical protein
MAVRNLGLIAAQDRGLEAAAKVLYGTWYELLGRRGSGEIYEQNIRTISGVLTLKRRPGSAFLTGSSGEGSAFNKRRTRENRLIAFGTRDGGRHQASARGEPPARDSGALQRSLFINQITKNEHYQVGTTLDYAVFLEFGIGPGYPFRSGAINRKGAPVRVHPRPHMRPAMQIALPHMNTNYVAALRTAHPIVFETIDLLAVRRGLLTLSATIGNLGAIGIRGGALSKLRQSALRTERVLGDAGAIATGRAGIRVARRLAGRQAGRLLGQMTAGTPPGFARRVQNRALSKLITTPALRRMFQGL